MSATPDEAEARNVMTALNGLRKHEGSKFDVAADTLASRANTDVDTVERVLGELQQREGFTVRQKENGQWMVRRS